MKRIRSIRVALVAAAAVLVVLPASATATPNLVLKEFEGRHTATVGEETEVVFATVECAFYSYGKVLANTAPKALLGGTTSGHAECPYSVQKISGLITETELTYKGAVTLKGSVTLALSPTCSYVFKNPKGTFEVPGWVNSEGTMTGKLAKGSSGNCAAEDTERFWMAAFGSETMFEDSLA